MHDEVAQVRALARRARIEADEVREEARRTGRLGDVDWLSAGADRWRDELRETAAALRRDAQQVDALADALAAHADGAEATLVAISAAREAFDRRLSDARSTLARAADEVSDHARQAAQHVVDAARRTPATWSPTWLSW